MLFFLTAMVVLTFLSRALDSMTVAQVSAGYAKRSAVFYELTGEGTIRAGDLFFVSLPEGMKVKKVDAAPGTAVAAGDVLLTLQMESLEEKRKELEIEREKIRIQMEEETLSSAAVPEVTQETLALQELEAVQKELAAGKEELDEVLNRFSVKSADLKQELDRKLSRSRDEVKEDAKRAMKSARRASEAARAARDSAVTKAQREVDDKQEELDRLLEEEASEEQIQRAERALERAEEDLEQVIEEQDVNVEEMDAKLDAAQSDYEDVDYGSEESREELRKQYEEAVEAEKDLVKAAEKQVKDLDDKLYRAMQNWENARVTDAGKRKSDEIRRELSALRQRSIQLDLEQIDKKLEKISSLIDSEGRIISPAGGVVANAKLQSGDRITADDQIEIAFGTLKVEAEMEKEDTELIKPGDILNIKKPGEQKSVEAVVEYVDQTGEGKAKLTAAMPEGEVGLGSNVGFNFKTESEIYSTVIPIEALREDSRGYFCLVAQPKKTILGEEMEAVKVDLEVLEKSSLQAAVSGALSTEMQIVVSSNKPVSQGDRVRVVN